MNRWIYCCIIRPYRLQRLSAYQRSYASTTARLHKATIPVQVPMTGTTSQSRSVPKSRPNWPWRTFVSAWSEGALAISPEMSSAFLNDVWNLATGGKLNRSNIQTILQERCMECQDLTSIAKLLIIQRSDIQLASLGLDLLSLSADLGSEDAALILVDISIERRSTMEIGTLRYQKALAHVKKLAIEKKNLQAYVVLGKVYEQAQQYEDAISMYKIAMDAHERGEIEEEDRTALAEAFRNAGQLFSIAPGMEDMAFKCFKTAARVYDDARSFYSMALISGEKSQDYVSLLSQAAISGVTEATYKLGIWYSTKGDYFDSGPRADATYTVACYWFELSKDLPALTARVTLHIARIERARVRMTEPRTTSASIQRVPKHIDLEQIGRNLPNENWSTLNLNVNAVKLESEMTKSAD